MKVDFPRYDNFVPHFSNEVYTREIDENDYLKSLDDFRTYINRFGVLDIEECGKYKTDILTSIDANKICEFLFEDLKHFKASKNSLMKNYPLGDVRNYWSEQFDLLAKEFKKTLIKSTKFIHQNKDDIFAILDEIKTQKIFHFMKI